MRTDSKKHKRMPSFKTRRRTQSFRIHTKNLSTMKSFPLVDRKLVQSCLLLELHITRKSYWIDLQELQSGGKPATIRSWKSFYTVLCGQLLCFLRLVDEISSLIKFNLKPNYFRDQEDFFEAKAASSPIMIYQVSLKKQDYTA